MNIRLCLVLAASLGTGLVAPHHARADAFAFKDLDGFEKCMKLDHMVETIKTDKGQQTRYLDQMEVHARCMETAVTVVAQSKDKDLGVGFVGVARRHGGPINAVGVVAALVGFSLPACNETSVYEVLMAPLVTTDDADPLLKHGKASIKRCLKDKDFTKDFLEEQSSGETNRAINACKILLEEKLVKSCKGAK
jgi:hypothetical protein